MCYLSLSRSITSAIIFLSGIKRSGVAAVLGLPNRLLCIQSRYFCRKWVHGTLSMCTRRMILHASRRIGKTKNDRPQAPTAVYRFTLYTRKATSRWTPPGELDVCNLCLMTQVALEIIHAILLAYPRASRQGRYHTV